jgi:soluble lytic murein transglycosylase-like protein
VFFVCAVPAHAEYAVLRNGQRLRITGWEQAECKAQEAPTPGAQAASATSLSSGLCYVLHIAGGRVSVAAADLVAIEPEDTFGPAAAELPRTPFDTHIAAAALKHGVDEKLITSVIAAESNFHPRAVSRKNARGLMQLMPETARRFGVTDVFDPAQNIDAGTRYLRELLDRYSGDLTLALAAYNAGPDRVTQYRGVPPFPETRAYLTRIAAHLKEAAQTSATLATAEGVELKRN